MTTVLLCNLTGLGQGEGSQQLPITTLLPYHLPPKLPSGEITQLHFSRSVSTSLPHLSQSHLGFGGEHLSPSWILKQGRIDVLKINPLLPTTPTQVSHS